MSALLAAPASARGARFRAVAQPALAAGDMVGGCRLGDEVAGAPCGRRFQAAAGDGATVLLQVLPGSDAASLARAAAAEGILALRHPHLEAVTAVRRVDGRTLVIGRPCSGPSLAGWLVACDTMPWRRALRLLHAIADGLRAAAAVGLVHGDLRPGCIQVGNAAAGPRLLGLGEAGAPHPDYLAPERSAGAPASVEADVYALGAVAFHAVSGRAPFGPASPLALAEAHASLRRPDVRTCVADVPAAFAEWIRRAMAIAPAARPDWDAVVLQLRSLIMTA